MTNCPLLPLIDYTGLAVSILANSQEMAGLLLDNSSLSMDSSEARALAGTRIWGYNPLAGGEMPALDAMVTVEAELVSHENATMDEWQLKIGAYVLKEAMFLDPDRFPGYNGNRRDALSTAADRLLSGSRLFGTGPLDTIACVVPDTPAGVFGRETVYRAYHRNRPAKRF